MLHRLGRSAGVLHGNTWPQQVHRHCRCRAKRGRPRKTEAQETPEFAEYQQPIDTGYEPAPRKRGRPRKTDVQAEEPLASTAAPLGPGQHDFIESLEMLQSAELDYNQDPNLADTAPPYTHAFQGPDSNELPPLMGGAYDGSGFVGEEAFDLQQQQQLPGAAVAGTGGALVPQQQLMQVQPTETAEEEEDDQLRNQDIPPGVYDYEAGLPFAQTTQDPDQLLEHFPPHFRPKSRKEAEYMMNWYNLVVSAEREKVQLDYENRARLFLCKQNKEAENIYSNAKAMAIVTAEIEIEDHDTGNRWDIFYPVWARAEHRWYPSGRFHAYNEYVKENIGELTMKYAPGHEQEEEFDIMEDAFMLADDPSIPGGGMAHEERALGPADGLGLDSFIEGMLPGAAASDLGASYLEDVLAPQEEELLEEDLE